MTDDDFKHIEEENDKETTLSIDTKPTTPYPEIKTQTFNASGFYFYDDIAYNDISMGVNPCGNAAPMKGRANISLIGIQFIILYFKCLKTVLR